MIIVRHHLLLGVVVPSSLPVGIFVVRFCVRGVISERSRRVADCAFGLSVFLFD